MEYYAHCAYFVHQTAAIFPITGYFVRVSHAAFNLDHSPQSSSAAESAAARFCNLEHWALWVDAFHDANRYREDTKHTLLAIGIDNSQLNRLLAVMHGTLNTANQWAVLLETRVTAGFHPTQRFEPEGQHLW